eukprot:g4210.t1
MSAFVLGGEIDNHAKDLRENVEVLDCKEIKDENDQGGDHVQVEEREEEVEADDFELPDDMVYASRKRAGATRNRAPLGKVVFSETLDSEAVHEGEEEEIGTKMGRICEDGVKVLDEVGNIHANVTMWIKFAPYAVECSGQRMYQLANSRGFMCSNECWQYNASDAERVNDYSADDEMNERKRNDDGNTFGGDGGGAVANGNGNSNYKNVLSDMQVGSGVRTRHATIECRECEEYFCEACFALVHSGGKRREHMFRRVFDIYGHPIQRKVWNEWGTQDEDDDTSSEEDTESDDD